MDELDCHSGRCRYSPSARTRHRRRKSTTEEQELRHQRRVSWSLYALPVFYVLLFCCSSTNALSIWPWDSQAPLRGAIAGAKCAQADPLFPKTKTEKLTKMDEALSSKDFETDAIDHLSGAVQIATESYDDLGPIGEDKRWDVMYDFAAYLEKTWPMTFSTLAVERVNVHGLFLTWTGSDPTLKPTLLMAHQDVVPVAPSTVSSWTHPPYSGYYDGESIWGRGSFDCKGQLTAILEAIEMLIKADFKPKRTVILTFGFDEEISGLQGARHLAPAVLERFGRDSIAVIVDEGSGFDVKWGASMAMPGVGEKGYFDVDITVRMPGGHSSIPPAQTSIGVIAELIELIEASPYEPHLATENPYFATLHCGAEHGPEFPDKLRELLNKSAELSDELANEAAKESLQTRYLLQTSQAITLIAGGVKVNALPERVTLTINQRINIGDTCATAEDKLARLASQIASKHNLSVHAFDGVEAASSIMLRTRAAKLEPAPITPTAVDAVTPYSVLAGTIRALYGEDVVVTPGLMTGNTDTRHYWDLSRHIFRFAAGWDGENAGLGNAHTVDEHITVAAHVNSIKWFSMFVRNMDEADMD